MHPRGGPKTADFLLNTLILLAFHQGHVYNATLCSLDLASKQTKDFDELLLYNLIAQVEVGGESVVSLLNMLILLLLWAEGN